MGAVLDIELVSGDVSWAGHTIARLAAKAVLVRDGELLMLRSRHGDHKFPGGGLEAGETLEQALERELREECGLVGVRAEELLVRVTERRPAREPGTVFSMVSSYVRTRLGAGAGTAAGSELDDYERELELTAVWVAPDVAREANARLLRDLDPGIVAREIPWLDRETRVLAEIVRLGLV